MKVINLYGGPSAEKVRQRHIEFYTFLDNRDVLDNILKHIGLK